MSDERRLTKTARPFLGYRPGPTPKPARRPAPRDAYRDACQFVERFGKLLGKEAYDRVGVNVSEPWERSDDRVAAARAEASALFGPPGIEPDDEDFRSGYPLRDWAWQASRSRIEQVFAWLDRFDDCAPASPTEWWGESVRASCGCVFWLRDPDTGRLLPRQHSTYKAPVHWDSQINLTLQASTLVNLDLVLPFEEPYEEARRFVRAIRPHLPVELDLGCLHHYVPRADLSKYDHGPVPSNWLD